LINNNEAVIIYPGIVLGNGGKSAQFFAEIASLPILPLIKLDNKFVFLQINKSSHIL